MKTLVCTHPFGNFTPGMTVEVSEEATFDTAYFRLHEEPEVTDHDKAGEQ